MTIPSGLPETPRWPCGHVKAIHVAKGAHTFPDRCRTCWLEDQAPEKVRARILAAPPVAQTFTVTSVSGGEVNGAPVADISGFIEGEAYEFFDDSDSIRVLREGYRGREAEANAARDEPVFTYGAWGGPLTVNKWADAVAILAGDQSNNPSAYDPLALANDQVGRRHLIHVPILRPAYDVDGRPLARPMNPHIVNHIADLVDGWRSSFNATVNRRRSYGFLSGINGV